MLHLSTAAEREAMRSVISAENKIIRRVVNYRLRLCETADNDTLGSYYFKFLHNTICVQKDARGTRLW